MGHGGGKIKRKSVFLLFIVIGLTLFLNISSACATEENQTISNDSEHIDTYEPIENLENSTSTQYAINETTNNTTNQNTNDTTNQNSTWEDNEDYITYTVTEAAGTSPIGIIKGAWVWSTSLSAIDPWDMRNRGYTDIFVLIPENNPGVIGQFIDKFQNTGIRIHAWILCFKSGNTWYVPDDVARQNQVRNLIANILNYNVAGIHLDYVRYGGTAGNYDLLHSDCTTSTPNDGYVYTNGNLDYSARVITEFVAKVRADINSLKSGILLSVAVMPEKWDNVKLYGQHYGRLSQYLDFLVPMIYKGNYGKDTTWIRDTTSWIVNHSTAPVVAGIQTYRSDSDTTLLSASELEFDANTAWANGSQGYVLFRYGLITPDFSPGITVIGSFTIDQIATAATWVKNYVDTNKKLPDYVTINNTSINIASFLQLLTTSVLNINNGISSNVTCTNHNPGPNPRDEIHSGTMQKAEYLKIAGDVKSFMDSRLVAPEYAYGTSLGYYFGYQSLVYMYSNIMSSYASNHVLPGSVAVDPWKSVVAVKFTTDQVATAATWVKNYVDTNKKLPDYVTINGIDVSMPSFLELLTTATLNINNGNVASLISLYTCGNAPHPRDEIKSGTMQKTEYLKIANDVKSFMDSKLVAPEYAYGTSLGNYLGYQSLVYMYSNIMSSYATNHTLPNSVGLKSWRFMSDPNAATFTTDQVATAATWVKNYVDTNKKLPDYVTINNINVSIPSFLQLLTTAVLNINNGINSTIDSMTCGNAPNPRDEIRSGTMQKTEYLKIANDVKSFMDSKLVAPEYAYGTSLGNYLGYQSLVYMYSSIMSSYATNHVLTGSVAVDPWKAVTSVKFTTDQVATAATWVKNYVDTNKKLPDYVTINNINVSMPSFLELLTTATLNINNGNSASLIALYACGNAPNPRDEIRSGSMSKSEYLKIAGDVKSFMDSKLVAPEYAYGTSLGYYLSYQSLVYMYSNIMSSYATNHTLPGSISVNPWVKFNISEVVSAASSVKQYVDTNHKLPNYVTISTYQVSMPSFLELLTTTLLKINNNDLNSIIYLYTCGNAPNPKDNIISGNMTKTEYLKIANDVKSFMDSKLVAPEYAYGTSLGNYLGYQNMIYIYSQILDYYSDNGVLPNNLAIEPWISICIPGLGNVSAELLPYIQPTNNCQSNDPNITSLAYSLVSGASSVWDAGSNIFEWVRDNLAYSFYYNTQKGALGTLNSMSGNCCDHTHLLIALARAVGIPAKYMHGDCTFSSGRYGHVWAQLYINGTWYDADATSSKNELGVINNWNTQTFTYKGTYRELPF